MMPFIKRHLMLLSCGALAVLSLAAIGAGVFYTSLNAEMEQAGRIATDLGKYRSKPTNDKMIDASKARSEAILRDYDSVMKFVKQTNLRNPIRSDVFPTPKGPSDVYDFIKDYRAALQALPKEAKAGPEPSDADIQSMNNRILREKEHAARMKGMGVDNAPKPPAGSAAAPVLGSPLTNRPAGSPFGGAAAKAGESKDLTPEEAAKEKADVRMSLTRAKEVHWYMTYPNSLHVAKDILETPPQNIQPPQLWMAQVGFWIQQDVIKALARLNAAEADKLVKANRANDAWVGYLPVKELINFNVGMYILGEPAQSAVATSMVEVSSAPPINNPALLFTRHTGGALYDVIPFALTLIIDAQSLPAVIDAISNANFFIPTYVSYREFRPVNYLVGKIYGPNPLLEVRFEFEACMFRDLYNVDTLMPPEMKQSLQNNALPPVLTGGGSVLR